MSFAGITRFWVRWLSIKKINTTLISSDCKIIMNDEAMSVEAQPGIAIWVTNFLMMTTPITPKHATINIKEVSSTRIATMSRNTENADSPCNTNELKFMVDLPNSRLPLSTETDSNACFERNTAPA